MSTKSYVLSMLGAAMLCVAVPAPAQTSSPTLKAIEARKAIVVGYPKDAYPMAFEGENGIAQGYSIDLCRRIAEEVGATLKMERIEVRYMPVTLASRFDDVASGKVDIECGTSTVTLSRMQKVDFTNLTFVDGGSLLVRKGSAIRNIASLVDETVAVIPGTTTDRALRAALSRSFVNAKIVEVPDHPAGIKAVESGKVTAYASDRVILVGLLTKSANPEALELAPGQFSYEPYGFAIRRGDADFRLVANRALARLYRSEDMAKIFDKWFGKLGKPGDVLVLMYALNGLPE
jgi:glutamate/aspartate transport system substrate-binding protein